jgi:hypothetical protein
MGRASGHKKHARRFKIPCAYCGKVKNINRIVAVTSGGMAVDFACVDCFRSFQGEFMHPEGCRCGGCDLSAYSRTESNQGTSSETV